MTSPISQISALVIGAVDSVAPDEIKVLLDIDSPRSTALNTGVPTPFPRINSFVLIPNESGHIVGMVVWLGVERSAYPKRQGLKDFGLIDLPFPLRRMTVCPIGTLLRKKEQWSLERGVQSFPSVGDSVILPSAEQTIAIVTGQGHDSRVILGTCPMAHGAEIAVDPDKLFGRHLAVLGNTGSGKSCTLAALIRSAIESAKTSIKGLPPKQRGSKLFGEIAEDKTHPNVRFIILDPNGEYSKCFKDLDCRVFQISGSFNKDENNPGSHFTLPAWMWNSSEWSAVAQASPKAQKPLLQEALRNLRSNVQITMTSKHRFITRCKSLRGFLSQFTGTGAMSFPNNNNCGIQLSLFAKDLDSYKSIPSNDISDEIDNILQKVNKLIDTKKWSSKDRQGFNDFGDTELASLVKDLESSINKTIPDGLANRTNEDSPLFFDTKHLAEHLEALAMQEGGSTSQFISTLTMRIKGILSDQRMSSVINPLENISLADWLEKHIGSDGGKNGPITIIDLSLVPYEILHLVIGVASRLILESLQRYRKIENKNLPTVLVLEEAHTFIAKRSSSGDEIFNSADLCKQIFERIAREGRKFGLGLVLSSQRPSELSETVLSQCNSFLLHRITNDRDQELISRLVPDNTRGLPRELPSLPTKHCILLGIASKIPTLIEIKHLKEENRPASDDPDFWHVWTNKEKRPVDWQKVANDWLNIDAADEDIDKKTAETV